MTAGLRRARSEEQKQARRQQILQAAEHYVTEVGYEAFSMAKLAQYSGVVKGTLYLYFNTREEVFLTLYNRSLLRWPFGTVISHNHSRSYPAPGTA